MKFLVKLSLATTQILIFSFSSVTFAAEFKCPLTIRANTTIEEFSEILDKEIIEKKGYIYLGAMDGGIEDVSVELSTDIRVGGLFNAFIFERGEVKVSIGNDLIASGKTVRRINLSTSSKYSPEKYQKTRRPRFK